MQQLEHGDQTAASFGELEPREIEFIRVYLVNGMNGTKAAAEAFGMDRNSASNKASRLLHDRRITTVINAEKYAQMRRLRIDADWVLEQAVEIVDRCMQTEKVLDRHGNLTGEFRFDAANSLKALNLIGKHINVNAFEKIQEGPRSEQILDRLRRGRERSLIAQRKITATGDTVERTLDSDGTKNCDSVSFI